MNNINASNIYNKFCKEYKTFMEDSSLCDNSELIEYLSFNTGNIKYKNLDADYNLIFEDLDTKEKFCCYYYDNAIILKQNKLNLDSYKYISISSNEIKTITINENGLFFEIYNFKVKQIISKYYNTNTLNSLSKYFDEDILNIKKLNRILESLNIIPDKEIALKDDRIQISYDKIVELEEIINVENSIYTSFCGFMTRNKNLFKTSNAHAQTH